ncbi:MAG: heparinase II/III family protein [Deltaproteobacteria bacterium]|nr:heparinase II/III family protein [Deltaproteobacteria bacterium]MBW2534947.1 heparinase II/III family protein [Deltaproteobacteria bacterium]
MAVQARVGSSLLTALALSALPGSASAEHPLLFFDPADVATLQARVAAGDPAASWYGSVKSGADSGLSYSGTDEAQRSRYARQMAFVHLIEGGQTYRDQTVAFLQTVGDYDTDWNDFGWVWGGDLLYYAMAYDWIQPALTTAEDDAIRAQLEAACDKTYGIYQVPPTSGTGKYYTNVRLRIAAGMGAASLALESYGEAPTRLAYVIEDLFGPSHTHPFQMSAVVARDGIYKEGSSYQNDSFNAMTPFLLAYEHVTGTSYYDATSTYDDRLGRMYRTNLQLMMPNRGAPTLNTGWMGVTSGHELVAGLLSDGAEQMWYWNEANNRSSSMAELSIVFYDEALDSANAAPAYTSQILDNAAVFRTGWTEDETWLLLSSDNEASRSTHDQPDQTAIALYASRAYLLIDPGDGRNYPSAEHYFLRYSPVAHNLVVIDGLEGPLLSGGSATPTKVYRYESDPDPVSDPAVLREGFVSDAFDYAESGIEGYEDVPDVSSARSVFFPGKDYVAVLDELSATSSHQYDHLLHFGGHEGASAIEGTLGIQSNEILWQTTNEDDESVELRVV